MFTFENIGKLIADVANQWGQQQLIAKTVRNLAGGKQIIQEANNKALTDFVGSGSNKYFTSLFDQFFIFGTFGIDDRFKLCHGDPFLGQLSFKSFFLCR